MDEANQVISAHKRSRINREEIFASDLCGCFYCLELYPPSEVTDWCDSGQTALCPKCGIDSVIGSQSGFDLSKEFLRDMHSHWFERLMDVPNVEERGEWQLRCPKCGRTKLFNEVGYRAGAASRGKRMLGWCSVCKWFRCAIVEKVRIKKATPARDAT